MGYRELVEDLIKSAEAERDGILIRSREESRNIINRAMEEAERIHLQNEKNLKKDVSKELREKKRERDKDLRVLRLEDRKELVETVFRRVEEKLRKLPGSRGYAGLARSLFEELEPEINGRPVTLRADPHAKKAIHPGLKSKGVRFEKLPDGEWGGLEAVLDDGKVRLKNTLKARYLKNREDLMIELARWMENDD